MSERFRARRYVIGRQTYRHHRTHFRLEPPLVNSTLFSTFSSLTWTCNLIREGVDGQVFWTMVSSFKKESLEDETFEDKARGEVGMAYSCALVVSTGTCLGEGCPVFNRVCPWTFVTAQDLLFLTQKKESGFFKGKVRLLTM
jgi:hypothetical protein